jgi:hypothetical protein
MKSSSVWNKTPCRPLIVNGRFEGTCLNVQDRRISQETSMEQVARRILVTDDEGDTILRNARWSARGLTTLYCRGQKFSLRDWVGIESVCSGTVQRGGERVQVGYTTAHSE